MRKIRPNSLIGFGLIALAASVLTLTIVLGLLHYLSLHTEDIALIQQRNETLSGRVEGFLSYHASIVETNAMILRETDMPEQQMKDYFTLQAQALEGVYEIFAGFPDGSFIISSKVDVEIFAPDRPWYLAAARNPGQVVLTDPYISISSGVPVFAIARTVNNYSSADGVVALAVYLDSLEHFLAYNQTGLEDSFSFVVDSLGNMFFYVYDHLATAATLSNILYHGIYISDDYIYVTADLIMSAWAVITRAPAAYVERTVAHKILAVVGFGIFSVAAPLALSINLKKTKSGLSAQQEANELNRAFLNTLPMAIELYDKDFNVIDCNEQSLELFGVKDKAKFLATSGTYYPEYQPNGERSEDFLEGKMAQAFASDDAIIFDFMASTSKEQPLPLSITLVKILYKEKETLVCYQNDLSDIKILIEKEIKANEFANQLLMKAPFFIEMWNRNVELVYCNDKVMDIFGAGVKEKWMDLFTKYSPRIQPCGMPSEMKVKKLIKTAFEKGYCATEWMHIAADGTPVPCNVMYFRFDKHGEEVVVGYNQDMREIRAALEKEQLANQESQSKTRFLSRMSHEVRTPMNSVMGIAEIQLQKGGHTDEVDEAFLRIFNSSKLLLGIINDILDLSKIEAGKTEIIKAVYETASFIADTVQLNLMYIGSKRINFNLNVCQYLPLYLIGDELRIKQILNNLLSNAFKYTDDGEVTLDFKIEDTGDNKPELVITVSDTGQGMTKEQIEKLFDTEYTRFNLEANRTIEGTGLGMAIAAHLIKLMGGSVNVESEVGVGSVFTVRLPQEIKGKEILGSAAAKSLANMEQTKSYLSRGEMKARELMPYGRVLVVDDVESNLYVANGFLQPYKLSIETVSSGFLAIEKIKEGNIYDVIFMDHMMPLMDGVETVKMIIETGYNRPIVALTANATVGSEEMFMKNGFDGFLSKPINPEALDACLMKFIYDRQSDEVKAAAKNQAMSQDAANKIIMHELPEALIESFLTDAKNSISILQPILQQKEFDNQSYRMFTMQAHALKSALANIKQPKLSSLAAKLEDASRNEDMGIIDELTPAFMEELTDVVDNLLKRNKGDNFANVKDDPDPELVKTKLKAMYDACSSYDNKAAKEILNELKNETLSAKTKEIFDNISKCLLLSEFEEAAEIAKSALGEI